jgi:hypothetical protein
MPHPRVTVAILMIAVLVLAAGLVALRVGSLACFRWVYALTAFALLAWIPKEGKPANKSA